MLSASSRSFHSWMFFNNNRAVLTEHSLAYKFKYKKYFYLKQAEKSDDPVSVDFLFAE